MQIHHVSADVVFEDALTGWDTALVKRVFGAKERRREVMVTASYEHAKTRIVRGGLR